MPMKSTRKNKVDPNWSEKLWLTEQRMYPNVAKIQF